MTVMRDVPYCALQWYILEYVRGGLTWGIWYSNSMGWQREQYRLQEWVKEVTMKLPGLEHSEPELAGFRVDSD